ncbi:hypothetical protein QN277_010628 [Acacia crassicarpa]|uniref:NB-ARC domain-containing protein n=1 Tax=Acacia crassicarpa TaxID=499986 RepID=A0AAE1INL0_9FABA|nr:hypothetical protein QN277_010628 [Acacia crassicarpa]
MASDFALYLRKKFVDSLSDVKTHLSDRTFHRFEKIGKHLGDNSTFLTKPESISLLHKLNDALADWRILKEQKNVIKEFFSFIDEAQMNEALTPIESELNEGSRRPPQPDFLLDRFTSIHNSGSSDILGFDEHVLAMRKYLWESGEGFKAVGIYGMGGSGKTALVIKVLNRVTVPGKFEPNNIIWTCLSDLTKEDEMDAKIAKYILHDLGFDMDSMSGNDHNEDDGWLMKQLERELNKLGNYVIVLDDVWHCNEWLTDLYETLAKTNGGAVIVTSRIEEVARKIVGGGENSLMIDLKPWVHKNTEDDKIDEFLKQMVLQSKYVTNEDDAIKIVGESHGLPLAAKMLPSLVNAPSEGRFSMLGYSDLRKGIYR